MSELISIAFLIIGLIAIVPIVLWMRISGTQRELASQREEIEELRRALAKLERRSVAAAPVVVQAPAPPPPKPAPVAEVVAVTPPPPPLPDPPSIPLPVVPRPPDKIAAPIPAAAPVFEQPSPPRWREWLGDQEWESLVGGNLLNKIGALVLVVGIALFLGYSFQRVGPAGRAAAGLLLSGALLGGGLWFERRSRLPIFANGLVGAGWAGLYVTTYAMGALDATRVIQNPLTASALLLLVGAAMVGHSLRYRRQAATAVAYFTAFAALAVTPSTPFAVIALIPLAGSLLYLAHRLDWYAMSLFGLAATYGTLISRGSSGSALFPTQALFLLYWLMFEVFDILRAHKRVTEPEAVALVFPVNALLFLALSYTKWNAAAPTELYQLAAGGAVLFMASAAARTMVRPVAAETTLADRITGGSFEGPVTVSAVLAALAILDKVPGIWSSAALATEAQVLYLAGGRLGWRYLEWLGAAAFAASLERMADKGTGSTPVLGHSIHNITPVAGLHAGCFLFNRLAQGWGARVFGYLAAALMTLAVGLESPNHFAGFFILALAGVLLEYGLRRGLDDFRHQGYGVAIAGLLVILFGELLEVKKFAPWQVWTGLAGAAALCLGGSARLFARDQLVSRLAAGAGAILTMAATWVFLPDVGVAMAWMALALGLSLVPGFTWHTQAVAAAVFARLFFANFTNVGHTAFLSHRLLSTAPIIAAFYYFWRRFDWRAANWAGMISLFVLLRFEMGRVFAVIGWAVLALLLLEASRRLSWRDFRYQSYGVAALTFLRAWSTNFSDPADIGGLPGRLLTAGVVIALFHATQLTAPRSDSQSRGLFGLFGVALLSLLLFHEVSGGLLTVAWGMQGVLLLAAGFPLRERFLRLPGLALLLGCILKLFLYDLRNLESFYRILSFIALGVILLAVSWVYTRFRDRIGEYL